jgi:diadenylate cyclase
MITEVVEAVKILSKRHIGALITIERDHSLQPFINTGIKLDAEVRSELLINIFSPLTPLHDGGVILSEGRIAAAACIYPVTQNLEFETKFGVRHRAALGLAEESDALTVIVSEETGDISLAIDSRVTRTINPATLQDRLVNIIKRNKTEE